MNTCVCGLCGEPFKPGDPHERKEDCFVALRNRRRSLVNALRAIRMDMNYCQKGCPTDGEYHARAIVNAEKTADSALEGLDHIRGPRSLRRKKS